ncbi:MAG TPA: epoxide hydrolase [Terracidiphilus sp.]|jgi:pimeloyl-ACP methyl ester carboxylesterase
MMQSFLPPYSQAAVDDMRRRLRQTRWPQIVSGADSSMGVDRGFLQDLCGYWMDTFSWKSQVDRFATLNHYRYQSREGYIHFIHEKGKGPSPLPLILTHGWPGSFLEMLKILPLLTDPAAYGHDAADAFDVVIPSLPGFGYSDKPVQPGMNFFRVAEIWAELMGALGYERFAVQGGDLGAGVSTALGLRHSHRIIGVHLNYIPGSYRPHLPDGVTLLATEERFLAIAASWFDLNGAYAHIQGTRPHTPAYALNDSPAGLAAWIIEKVREWSDCEGDLYRSFTRDELLANVTLYWMTQTISSSFLIYHEGRKAPLRFTSDDFVHVPCAIAHFPKEIVFPPQEWVERGYNVQRWTEMPKGGHFAAAEQPDLLAADIRAFFRPLR